ncbi:MAG: hypothetical protein FIA82_08705 [Melioribacter sp.]|nr:hypothetical protein [Melioribacter sp.]
MRSDTSTQIQSAKKIDIRKVTALWGFSEAALGGILHVLKVPFTGIFIGGAAVIFITLIANSSNNKTQILKSTLLVILVKAVVSPYTPFTAYFAVILQGVLGYILFSLIRFEKAATIILGFLSLTFASLQKLIVLTVVFGTSLWEAIDLFIKYVLDQIGFNSLHESLNFSYILISIYCGLHVLSGIFIGIKAAGFRDNLLKKSDSLDQKYFSLNQYEELLSVKKKNKKRYWWFRPSGIILLTISILTMIISYFTPKLGKIEAFDILFMILRSLVITFVWFTIISPFIIKYFKKIIEKNKFKYATEINQITELFPGFRLTINYCWKETKHLSGLTRIRKFLSDSLAALLTYEPIK